MESSLKDPTVRREDPRDAVMLDVADYGVAGRAAWRDVEWRAHLHSERIGGRIVNFVQYGDPAAPPVVLIHGLAGCWQNWLENIPALGEDFNVIVPDLPGFGESDAPAGRITIPGYARVTVGLLNALGIERAPIIGNSMGGQTAAQAAIDFPDRIGELILVSPAGYSTCTTPALLPRLAGLGGYLLPRATVHRHALVSRPRLRFIAMGGIVSHPERLSKELLYEIIGGDAKIGFAQAARAVVEHDFRDRLAEVRSKTLVVFGRDDRLVTSRDAVRIAARIPDARAIILRDTGHCAMAERPGWFNPVARDFLLGR